MKTMPAPTEESKVFGKYLSKLDLFDKPFFIVAKVWRASKIGERSPRRGLNSTQPKR
jgi:hypothetical protein